MSTSVSTIWNEKYRPKTVKHMILPKKLKDYFLKLVEQKEIPNLLLYSTSPGSGKSSVAKALVNDINAEYLYINASKDMGIDDVRERITRFASTGSMNMMDTTLAKHKVVILDEADGIKGDAQKALRALIEEFESVCRFILTCNYIHAIKEALESRCETVDFNFNASDVALEMKPQIIKRVKGILTTENVGFNEGAVERFVDKYYPDIRKITKVLQQYSRVTGYIDSGIFAFKSLDDSFYELLYARKIDPIRKYLLDHTYDYTDLYRNLYDDFVPKLKMNSSKASAILIIADFMDQDGRSSDKEITFMACLVDLIVNVITKETQGN